MLGAAPLTPRVAFGAVNALGTLDTFGADGTIESCQVFSPFEVLWFVKARHVVVLVWSVRSFASDHLAKLKAQGVRNLTPTLSFASER